MKVSDGVVELKISEALYTGDSFGATAYLCQSNDRDSIGSDGFSIDVGTEAPPIPVDPADHPTAQLHFLWIEPEYQSMGLGSRVMSLLLDFMQKWGVKLAWGFITPGPNAERNLAFYRKLGFEVIPSNQQGPSVRRRGFPYIVWKRL